MFVWNKIVLHVKTVIILKSEYAYNSRNLHKFIKLLQTLFSKCNQTLVNDQKSNHIMSIIINSVICKILYSTVSLEWSIPEKEIENLLQISEYFFKMHLIVYR